MDFDVAIIGAGPSGLSAAIQLSKHGKKVILIDRSEEAKIGFVLGGGVVKLDAFNSLGVKRSTGDELLAFLDTFNVYTPTGKSHKTTTYSGIVSSRSLLFQRLLGIARDQGVFIKHSTEVKCLNIDNDIVTGVTTDNDEVINAKVTIDSSGITRKFIAQLPDSFKIEKDIKVKDIARGYAYIFEKPEKNTHLTAYLAVNDGYIWKTPTEVGYGSINPDIDLKSTLDAFIKQHIKIESEIKHYYTGSIPVRQNISNMVGNGFVILGDSACMTNPIEGTGLATGMFGAKMASNVINKCLELNDVSQKSLWLFNVEYNKTQGANLAYMDMLRKGIVGLAPDDMDFAFDREIITSKDVNDSVTGAITSMGSLDKAQRALRGIRRPSILFRMEECTYRSKDLKNHYIHYPISIEGLDSWVHKLDQINNSFI